MLQFLTEGSLCFFFYILLSLALQRGRRGTNSGGEDEAEDEPHTPLPPPMEIIKDPSAQEEKVQEALLINLLAY